MKTITHCILAVVFVGVLLAQPATAAQPKKGGQLLMEMSTVKTVGDAQALKSGDTIAMACSKCKTIWVSKVKPGAKGAEVLMADGKPTQLIGTHACKGCGSEVVIKGHGKGKKALLVHTCKACGEHSAFCCSTTKGAKKE